MRGQRERQGNRLVSCPTVIWVRQSPSQDWLGSLVVVSISQTTWCDWGSCPGLGARDPDYASSGPSRGVLSLGLIFLVCKGKEAAHQCPLKVLSVPEVKV